MSWTGVNWTIEYPRFLVDLNGDGRADVVGCGRTGTWISRNEGGGAFAIPEAAFHDLGYNQGWRVERHVRSIGCFTTASPDVADGGELTTRAATRGGGPVGRTPTGGGAAARSAAGLDPGRFRFVHRPGLLGFGDHGVWAAAGISGGRLAAPKLVAANFSIEQGWQVGQHPRILADLTGDGLSDIVGFGNDGVWIALCSGGGDSTGFAEARFVLANLGANQGWRMDRHVRAAADLTGDRRADIIGCGTDGVWTSLGSGDGSFAETKFVLANFGANQGWRPDRHPRLAVDLNGDRRADIVGFGTAGIWTSLGNGDGSFGEPQFALANFGYNQSWRVERHARFAVDLTGDGKLDIVGFGNDGVWTSLGNGDGTFAEPRFVLANFGYNQGWRPELHPRHLADVTGDGKLDIVGFGDAGVWIALGNGDGTFGEARFVLADYGAKSAQTGIEHVFVCMLENRSYDHFLGLTPIDGVDAETGAPRSADRLKGDEVQYFGQEAFAVSDQATDRIDVGPPHDFNDFVIALCGEQRKGFNPNGGSYPPVTGSGYAAAYGFATSHDKAGEIMKCFPPGHLRVLNQLAQEFTVCDNWFASMPGPTEPNRMFAHAATCDTWDDSPSAKEQIEAQAYGGIAFDDGTIFDRLRKANIKFRIYAGDDFPNAAILKGVSVYHDIDDYEDFRHDLHDGYDVPYTFIEPEYAVTNPLDDKFYEGNSQHPRGSVAAGEKFIKSVYETIRNSPVWESSLLIVTYDEGGGFYDHVPPPPAAPTGKRGKFHGFMFDRLGTRVPAIVISPLVPKHVIEHRTLEHSVIPATVEQLFDLESLTARDGGMVGLQTLAMLQAPRSDTPDVLQDAFTAARPLATDDVGPLVTPVFSPSDPLPAPPGENLIPALHSAVVQHIAAMPDRKDEIRARVAAIETLGDYQAYMREVAEIVRRKRAESRAARLMVRDAVVRHLVQPVA